jgi:hypothetical protein
MVTLQISELVLVTLQIIGGLFWLYAIYPLTKSGLKLTPLVIGGALIVGAGALKSNDQPQPGPIPTPGPSPLPPPSGTFADQIKRTFDGTHAEAQILAALHAQMSAALEFDGRRAKPAVTTTTQMGSLFAEMQRYRAGAEAPWGDRFPEMKQAIAAEATARGIIGQGSQPFDAQRRAAAVQFYRDLGQIFSSIS